MRDTGADKHQEMDDIRAVLQRYRIPTFAYHTWSPVRPGALETGGPGPGPSARELERRGDWLKGGASTTPPSPEGGAMKGGTGQGASRPISGAGLEGVTTLATHPIEVPKGSSSREPSSVVKGQEPVPWSMPEDLVDASTVPLFEGMSVSPQVLERLMWRPKPTVAVCEPLEEPDDVLSDALEEDVPAKEEEKRSTPETSLGLGSGLKGFFLRGVVDA